MINEGTEVKNLREHDSVFIKNPTSEDFSWKFNGETYTVKAGDTKSFSKFVAFHLAKHLSTQIIVEQAREKVTEKERTDRNSPIHGKISQLQVYDTPERRIALFQIFEHPELVVQCVAIYPFKGFIGEMDVYKKYVEKYSEDKNKSRSNSTSNTGSQN